MRFRIELNGLVASVIAGHVALAAVDAHLRIDQGHHVLSAVQKKKLKLNIFISTDSILDGFKLSFFINKLLTASCLN